MQKLVLAIAGAELETSEAFNLARLHVVNPNVEGGFLSGLEDDLLHLRLRALDHLFDAGRVNASVPDERLHGPPRHFPANAVEPADHDHAGGVIHDDVHSGSLLKRADVAALATDDTALHLVARQVHRRDDALGAMIGRVALDGDPEHSARLAFGILLGLGNAAGDPLGAFLLQFYLETAQQESLRLLAGKPRDLVEGDLLLLDETLQLRLLGVDFLALEGKASLQAFDVVLFLVEDVHLPFEVVLALGDALLQLTQFGAAGAYLALEGLSAPKGLLLRGEAGLFLYTFGFFLSLRDDLALASQAATALNQPEQEDRQRSEACAGNSNEDSC